MKTLATIQDVVELVNANNYYYKDNEFNDYFELKEAAEEHFKSFDLPSGEVHLDKVKTEKYFVEEVNTTVTVEFYEAYIDSGVSKEDYFYGFIINY